MENNYISPQLKAKLLSLQRKGRKEPTALYFCIFCQFIISMRMWIGWDGREKYLQLLLFLLSIYLITARQVKLNYNVRNTLTLLTFSVAYIWLKGISIWLLLPILCPLYIIISLNDEDRISCFRYIFKWFALLMVPSIIAWLIYLSVGLPSIGQIWLTTGKTVHDPWYVIRNNHIFLITYALKETTRFCGYFLEPGHLGMVAAFLLYADGFDFKKKTSWVILITVILTFSLAGYVLLLMGYLFAKYEKREIGLKFVLFFGILILFVYLFGTFYNGGENLINERIFSRLEHDEDRGIVGNNRALGEIPLYFARMFNDWHLILFGYDAALIKDLAEEGSRGTGLQYFMVCYGLIGVLFSFSSYLVYLLFTKDKKHVLLLFIFILLILLQRSSWHWFALLICYIYGITIREKQKLRLGKTKKLKR